MTDTLTKLTENYPTWRKLALTDVALFLPFDSKLYERPRHLKPLTDIMNRYKDNEYFNATIHVPPQHYKTTTITYGAANILLNNPTKRIIYASYQQTFAESRTRPIPKLLKKYGKKLVIENASETELEEGGSLITTSVGGQGSGLPCELFIIDDPFKDRASVESKLTRNKVWDWFLDTVYARVREGKTSLLVNHTRWHKDDLIGRIQAQNDVLFEHYRIPALYDGLDNLGRAENHTMPLGTPLLWTEKFYRAIESLKPYSYQSMYQGIPKNKGDTIFRDAYYYTSIPDGYKIQIGSDFAYSTKTRADYTVFVIMKVVGDVRYITDVIRYQKESPYTREMIVKLYDRYKSPIAAEANGPQKGVYDMVKGSLPYGMLIAKNPTTDKVTRSENLAAAWNEGKILLPDPELFPCIWLEDYLEEMHNFTGVSDVHDDCIDATVMADENKSYQPMMYGIN